MNGCKFYEEDQIVSPDKFLDEIRRRSEVVETARAQKLQEKSNHEQNDNKYCYYSEGEEENQYDRISEYQEF